MSTAFRVVLTGDQEVTVPPGGTGSEATGLGTVIFDDSDPLAPTASYSITIEGVDFGTALGDKPQTPKTDDDVTRTHFHTADAGVNGPIVFGQIDLVAPANEDDTDDLSVVLNKDHSWTISGVWEQSDPAGSSINNFAGVLGSATVGTAVPLYFNVHTSEFGAGEIRGQLVAIADDSSNIVRGTAGHDLLPGLGGDDIILGDDGKDVMDGGVGNDTLTGGKDADTFFFSADFGHDTITDLTSQDQIQFEDGLFENPQSVLEASEQVGDNVVITLDADNTITLLDVHLQTLQAHDFLT